MPPCEQTSSSHHAGRAQMVAAARLQEMKRRKVSHNDLFSKVRKAIITRKISTMSRERPFSILIYELVAAARLRDRSEPQATQAFDQLIGDIQKAPVPEEGENIMLNRFNLIIGRARFKERVADIRQKSHLGLLRDELQLALTKVDECVAAMREDGPPNDQRKRRAQEAVDEQMSQVEAVRKRMKVRTPRRMKSATR